jgi:hypothetical protein
MDQQLARGQRSRQPASQPPTVWQRPQQIQARVRHDALAAPANLQALDHPVTFTSKVLFDLG